MDFNINMKNVSVRYGKFEALKDISISLEPGKVYGLIGRNGAGKTSLLSVLASFRKPSEGIVTMNDERLFENEEMMPYVSFVYQRDFSEEYTKVAKFLKNQALYRSNFDASYAAELVEKFGLPLKKRVKNLSKGMQSVIGVIIGLASRTPLTIFDEAYLGMDAPTRDLFYKELLLDQERYPRTIIMSTHLVSEMDYLFDEVILIHQGKLVIQAAYYDVISLGATVTGTLEAVDSFITSKEILTTQVLGGIKQATLYGKLSDQERLAAQNLGLEIRSVPLQDLFIHLTKEGAS